MERTIKFRAYSGEGVWTYMELKEGRWDIRTFPLKEGVVLNPRNWMQFTSLQDHRHQDIYEGDILFYNKMRWDKPREVVFKDGMFQLKKSEVSYTPLNIVLAAKNRDNCEILGNIYENPELLED